MLLFDVGVLVDFSVCWVAYIWFGFLELVWIYLGCFTLLGVLLRGLCVVGACLLLLFACFGFVGTRFCI